MVDEYGMTAIRYPLTALRRVVGLLQMIEEALFL